MESSPGSALRLRPGGRDRARSGSVGRANRHPGAVSGSRRAGASTALADGRGRAPAHRSGGALQRSPPREARARRRRASRPRPGARALDPRRRCRLRSFGQRAAGGLFRPRRDGRAGTQRRRDTHGGERSRKRDDRHHQTAVHRGCGSGGERVISVLVADDHPVVRDGLCTMLELEADIKVVGRAADGAEAVEQARRTHPDVILLDVQMPVMDGIEALRKIRARDPEAPLSVLTTNRNEDYILPSLKAGALGYLLKDAPREELAGAIRAVAAGESLLDPQLVSAAAEHMPSITRRERDVLRLMADGKNNAEIAVLLFVSEHTVKTHVSNILEKLGCKDRAAAVLLAWRRHII